MNYRHAYHAGNFADVLKHLVLALVIDHLKQKPAPFRVVDTHAGVGLYDLSSLEADKTGEWRGGIGRVLSPDDPLPAGVAAAMAPYLDAVSAENGDGGGLRFYPGSPRVARHLLRAGDRLVVNALHPVDHASLAALFARDGQVKVLNLDGWTALKSLLPPPERRGVVLVDPPFEEAGDLERLVTGVKEARRRFATGVLLLWYPIKDLKPVERFHAALEGLALDKALTVELFIRPPQEPDRLNGAGLVVINPPYGLADRLQAVLPELIRRVGVEPGATFVLEPGVHIARR